MSVIQVALKQRLSMVKKRMHHHLHRPMHVAKQDYGPDKKDLKRRLHRSATRCEDLEERLADTQDELEELRVQIISMDRERDTTPAALWFFSALHNPRLPKVVANHLQQLNALKGVADGKEHFDFLVLKQRLESCFSGVPHIQNFFKKFSALHKKYVQSRCKLFLDRKLIGGDADAYFVCPMCNTDSRDNPIVTLVPQEQGNDCRKKLKTEGSSSLGGGVVGSPVKSSPSRGIGMRSPGGR